MSKSAIEWTDDTWNPVSGCTRVSARWPDLGRVPRGGAMMHIPEDPRPDVGCVVKAVAIIGALAVLALIIYMGGVA